MEFVRASGEHLSRALEQKLLARSKTSACFYAQQMQQSDDIENRADQTPYLYLTHAVLRIAKKTEKKIV